MEEEMKQFLIVGMAILLLALSVGASSFFGQQGANNGTDGANTAHVFTDTTSAEMICPGTPGALMMVDSIWGIAKSSGAGVDYLRFGIYNKTKDTLFAQTADKILIPTWATSVLPFGAKCKIKQYYPLISGNSYYPCEAVQYSYAATGRGQLEAVYQMDPTMGKGWLIEDDPHTRETHRAAGEQGIIDLDEEFKVGDDSMQTPGTGDLAEENCNCRCGMYFAPMEAE
jgi:hypothetical protein